VSSKREPVSLNFSFTPVPNSIIDAWIAGTCPDALYRLMILLYRRAESGLLAKRQPTPRVALDQQLRTDLHYPHELESLQRQLRQWRRLGYFTYRLDGSSRNGYRYVFTLFPDGPKASANDPSIEGTSDPPIDAGQTPSQIQETAPAGSGSSANAEQVASASHPSDPPDDPSIEERANPLPEPRSADSETPQNPGSSVALDVLETPTTLPEGRSLCETSPRAVVNYDARGDVANKQSKEGDSTGEGADRLLAALEEAHNKSHPRQEPGVDQPPPWQVLADREREKHDRCGGRGAELRALHDGPPATEEATLLEAEELRVATGGRWEDGRDG
jgi:hypothetical protein